MESFYIIGTFLFVLALLLGSGLWVGLALLGCAYVGMELFTTRPTGDAMMTILWRSSSSWSLTALPLFIWMGEILYRTRLSEDMFKGLAPWLSRLPGGLLHTNIVGSTVFAAVSGSSAATCSTIGRMSIPELRKRNYPESMIMGTLAGAATLGLLIPPSLILIVYGVTINESISKLFLAGIIPGLVLALLFMLYTGIAARFSRTWKPEQEPTISFKEKLWRSRSLFPVIALIGMVIGSMYAGIATATEAAAVGVVGALIIAALQGSLRWGTFIDSLLGATRTSAMIALLLAGAAFLTLAMGFIGLPRTLATWIGTLGLSQLELLFVLLLFYIVIGMFLDGISAVVLTISIVEPIIRQAGIDPIWFGVFVVITVEMAQITPPVGFNLFILQGMTGHDLGYLAKAAFPMFLVMILMVTLLIIWPEMATWLPQQIRQ
ncbi:TRAP transporter large permease [Alcaligenes endophyticus]|uniref:TRAP transporter large permease protein n=1 Tax=Alcaligenes endophyticus TaxID=1929088 RepID=A0ABT8EF75_9BURK|nr:TRAP transporter large permease subunit [Alcaligenes endophyticus]MCX5590403.1 TRAP transporter large permease subunit [Alcaligenes endophyticus]MDN4119933.1 TRAP transporter large permease subunit [Alcaligenes endophyticus]